MPASKHRKGKRKRLHREDWLNAAVDVLVREGISEVKVDRLARDLGVTRGGFYNNFENRQDLLDAILHRWEQSNMAPFDTVLSNNYTSAMDAFTELTRMFLEERNYSPAFDSAMRAWAKVSPAVEKAVRRIDERRVDMIKGIFLRLGYDETDALVRARIAYFHQVGYYTLSIRESMKSRRELLPYYNRVLTGIDSD